MRVGERKEIKRKFSVTFCAYGEMGNMTSKLSCSLIHVLCTGFGHFKFIFILLQKEMIYMMS
jgi:hypothetical protein